MNIIDLSLRDYRDNSAQNKDTIAAIVRGLVAYNSSVRPDPDSRPITLAVRDDQGTVTAGLLGVIGYEWLRVDVLWVAEDLRGKGVGAALMRRAENIATAAGCRGLHLDTFDFQAPRFYERLGYKRFRELKNYPGVDSHSYYMKLIKT